MFEVCYDAKVSWFVSEGLKKSLTSVYFTIDLSMYFISKDTVANFTSLQWVRQA